MKAFYYDRNYYLLPEQFDSVVELQAAVTRIFPVSMHFLHLQENRCQAPYFVEEEIVSRKVTIRYPERLYPVLATILPRLEYDRRLGSLVEQFCPGCTRYGGDSSDLTGHHEEMTLDGVCCERQEEGEADPFCCFVFSFWDQFLQIEPDLIKQIEAGRANDAAARIGQMLCFLPPPFLTVGKKGRRYILLLSAMNQPVTHLLYDYLVCRAPEQLKNHWQFHSYLPRGVYEYQPISPTWDSRTAPPMLSALREECDRPRYRLLAEPMRLPEEYSDLATDSYLYLCQEYGENRLAAGLSELYLIYGDQEEDGLERIADIRRQGTRYSIAQFRRRLNKLFSGGKDKALLQPPLCYMVGIGMEPGTAKGERYDIHTMYTCSTALTTDLLQETSDSLQELFDMGITVGSLIFERGQDPEREEQDVAYLRWVLLTYVQENLLIKFFATNFGDTRFSFDFLILDSKLVKKRIQEYSPIFKYHRGKFLETTKEGTRVYGIDFILREE